MKSKVHVEELSLLSPTEEAAERLEGLPVAPSTEIARRPIAVTACYCFIMVINGGLCGAFGPSLQPFARQTGASAGALGSAVMQNRLAKLGGTVLWGWFAARVQQQKRDGETLALKPHMLMSLSLLFLAASCAMFGRARSGATLNATFIVSGFMYGVSDSAANLLITWVWQHDSRKQRINVAILNASFTVGAFVTPILCAGSMHRLHGHVWPAYYVLACCAIVEACILPTLPNPPAPRAATPRRHKGVFTEEDGEDTADEGASTGGGTPGGTPSKGNSSSMTSPDVPATASKTPEGKAGLVRCGGGGGGGASAGCGNAAAVGAAAASSITAGDDEWVYVGDPEAEAVLPRYLIVMVAICTLCFFANGCEHAVATWLSSFGIQQRGLGEETMAIMTSNFWTAMSIGRIAWACLSGFITSAWPCLFANTVCCIVSALCMFVPSQTLLWSSAVGIGLGVASSFPAAVTLPAEIGIVMSPRMMTTLQLAASGGEMLCPFLMGVAFQFRAYRLFYMLMLGWETFVLCLLGLPWGLLTRRIPIPRSVLRSISALEHVSYVSA